MTKPRAVLFDLDGTLRDSRAAIYGALAHTFGEHTNLVPTRDNLAPYIHHFHAVHDALASEVEHEKFRISYSSKLDELMPESSLYEGVRDTLEWICGGGMKVGLVSATRSAAGYLESEKLDHLFDAIVSGDDDVKDKPDPEPVDLALARLDIAADRAVIVGDLATDIQAGKSAGLAATIGITHGFGTRESLEAVGADYVIDSLAELPDALQQIE